MASHPFPGDKPPDHGRVAWKNTGPQKTDEWNLFSYIVTPWLFTLSDLSCIDMQPPPSFLGWRLHHSKATFTPSIQHILGFPRTLPPLTSAINTILVIHYSSILSTCPNDLNTLWSGLLANPLSIPALLHTSSFLTLSIHDTPTNLLKHFVWRTFTFRLSALLIPPPYNAVGTIIPSCRHFLAFIPSPPLLCTLFSTPDTRTKQKCAQSTQSSTNAPCLSTPSYLSHIVTQSSLTFLYYLRKLHTIHTI